MFSTFLARLVSRPKENLVTHVRPRLLARSPEQPVFLVYHRSRDQYHKFMCLRTISAAQPALRQCMFPPTEPRALAATQKHVRAALYMLPSYKFRRAKPWVHAQVSYAL